MNKSWIIGASKAIRSETIHEIKIEYDKESYSAFAYGDTGLCLSLICMDSDKEKFNEELNKILN
jgi:hypothetical protein